MFPEGSGHDRDPDKSSREFLQDELLSTFNVLRSWKELGSKASEKLIEQSLQQSSTIIARLDYYMDTRALYKEERDWANEQRTLLLSYLHKCGWKPVFDTSQSWATFDSFTRPRSN